MINVKHCHDQHADKKVPSVKSCDIFMSWRCQEAPNQKLLTELWTEDEVKSDPTGFFCRINWYLFSSSCEWKMKGGSGSRKPLSIATVAQAPDLWMEYEMIPWSRIFSIGSYCWPNSSSWEWKMRRGQKKLEVSIDKWWCPGSSSCERKMEGQVDTDI